VNATVKARSLVGLAGFANVECTIARGLPHDRVIDLIARSVDSTIDLMPHVR
jgi:hypothetical protein